MAAPLKCTGTPGVYIRGSRWVAVYLEDGRQRRRSAATFREAREIKVRATAREAARRAGPTLHSYAWSGSITTPVAAPTTSSTTAPAANTGAC
jgi:hypothetical protein